jgi:hypothetical protein
MIRFTTAQLPFLHFFLAFQGAESEKSCMGGFNSM